MGGEQKIAQSVNCVRVPTEMILCGISKLLIGRVLCLGIFF